MPRNPDAFAPLGDEILDFEGEPRAILRDFDCLVIPAVTLPPAGVRDLENRIAEYWRETALYRLRTADLSGMDLNLVRGQLAYVGFGPYLPSADWPEVARRLAALGDMGGLGELRKLSALLTGDEIPAEAPEDGPLCSGCGDPAGAGPTPIENGGVICADCAAEAKAAGTFPFEPAGDRDA
jgi:hypothetical protein